MLIEFELTSKELLHALGLFRQETINEIPFANSWSAAQVADHLLKSDNLIIRTLEGEHFPSHRAPDEKVEELRTTFMDFSTKMEAMEVLLPGDDNFSKNDLIEDLKSTRERMVADIHSADLSDTFNTPSFGEITRLELLYFVIFHTKRHIRQLKNIYVALPTVHGNSFPY